MTIQNDYENAKNELDVLKSRYMALGKEIDSKVLEVYLLFTELNANNYTKPQWLFANPTAPGVYETIQKLIEDNYGLYNGPVHSGYIPYENNTKAQANFDFILECYASEPSKKQEHREHVLNNCRHFVVNYLKYFEPVIDMKGNKVVPFTFRSQESGIDYLGYDPVENIWYHYFLRYGSIEIRKSFPSFDVAIEYAYDLAQH